MNVGSNLIDPDPNESWLNCKGVWLSYIIFIFIVHFCLLSIPWVSVPWAWTFTNLIHNISLFILLHMTKGTPWFNPITQGKLRRLTHWEQIDHGRQFTATRKFFTVIPIILFFLASFYTKYDSFHFVLNALSLILVLIPKLPQLHGVRLFGINKY